MASTPPVRERPTAFLSPTFRKQAFAVDRTRPIVFVCGAKKDDSKSSLRQEFLDEIGKRPPRIIPVLAEHSFPHQLVERNLQRFEEFLASAADCILIFPESTGSFAETGLFARVSEVAKKTLIVNARKYASEKSFLNLGPIKLIRKASKFDTVVDLDATTVTSVDAERIVEVIVGVYPKYENALVFHPAAKFSELDLRLQLACIHITVTLLRAASPSLVTTTLRDHFGAVDAETIARFLSLLTSVRALQRKDELYFNPNPNVRVFDGDPLIRSASFPVDTMRAKALEWQTENNSQATVFIRDKFGVDV